MLVPLTLVVGIVVAFLHTTFMRPKPTKPLGLL